MTGYKRLSSQDVVWYFSAMPLQLSMIAYGFFVYLLGSLNLSLLACRVLKIRDIRASGSGNPGVTNLYRAAGLKAALPVLAADLGKAYLAVALARTMGFDEAAPAFALPYVAGNVLPVFHGFRGGKGVAAVVGSFLAINPFIMLSGGMVFILSFAVFRRVSVGSLAMALSYPGFAFLLGEGRAALATAAICLIIVAWTHRANISRLLAGEEPRFELKR